MKKEFENAEELLVSKELHELSKEEQQFIVQQFGNMEEAQGYRDFLLGLKQELVSSSNDIPEPDVFIAERVKSRMREKKREAGEPRGLLQNIFGLLNYKIKVYQSVMAMLVVVAAFFFITKHSEEGVQAGRDILYADSSAVHTDSVLMERR